MKHLLLFFIITSYVHLACAQAIINTRVERSTASTSYARLTYGNDFFTATDFYLTQAIQLEFVHPALAKVPVYKLLYAPDKAHDVYGLSVEHNAYTPVHYSRPAIQYGDRPFAADLMLHLFAIHTDALHQSRWSSRLSMGDIGPAAFGKSMQSYIHEHLDNAVPQGWNNQIKNDVVLNYEVIYQRSVVQVDEHFTLTADALARLGTLSTKANVGLTMMAGVFKNPFAFGNATGRRFQLYAYYHPELNVVGYDATMQGGLFRRDSPYTIAAADVSRFVFEHNWGLVLQTGKFYLEYYQTYTTKEFEEGMDFHNGGILVGLKF